MTLLSVIYASKSTTVEMFNGERWKLNPFKAADVHRCHVIARRVGSFTERVYSALWAEPIFDCVFAKCVGAHIFVWREQPKLLPWNEPKKWSFSGTDWAIAVYDLREFAFNFKGDLPAMTATIKNHFVAPLDIRELVFPRFLASREWWDVWRPTPEITGKFKLRNAVE